MALSIALVAAGEAQAACEDVVPPEGAGGTRGTGTGGSSRMILPEDLVALRDIGTPDAAAVPATSPLAVSPEGTRVAFVITRADPVTNVVCRALVVLDLVPGALPRVIDRGGEFIFYAYAIRGYMMNPGAPQSVTPVWSPDGRSLAYRKRLDGRTEAWVAQADGGGARLAARLDADVDALAWSADGSRLLLFYQPDLGAQAHALDVEGRSGFLYDERIQPYDSARPALMPSGKREVRAVTLATGAIDVAGDAEAATVGPGHRALAPGVRPTTGERAWLVREAKGLASPTRVTALAGDDRIVACTVPVCTGAIMGVFSFAGDVVYLRREGWANGTYALYRWRPGRGAPRRILATEEAVHGCVPALARLICMIEQAREPRRIVAVDPGNGRRQVLFDPNPEFRRLRLGEVRRIKVRNDRGYEAWGDLVLPPGYSAGRIPMVVVQYHSDGFLRGGTGDDYPVHAFAARGLAVLSFERPKSIASRDASLATAFDLKAVNARDWADRRSILSALELLVAEAVRIGVADPDRVGITGLSDGSTTAAFALLNSQAFAAAAISTCCLEPSMTTVYGGPRYADEQKRQGYPPLGRDDPAFWAPMSLARGAARIDAPILMQLADREYLTALDSWAHLKAAGKPVEMFVYPDEYHNKWQPSHRLATYRRSLDWFDYWLAGRREPGPEKAAQYSRWDALPGRRRPGG